MKTDAQKLQLSWIAGSCFFTIICYKNADFKIKRQECCVTPSNAVPVASRRQMQYQ